MRIEIQFRSRLKHAWAAAVETVGTASGQALKSSEGDEGWLRFFVLMASEIAFSEGCPSSRILPMTEPAFGASSPLPVRSTRLRAL